MKEYIVFALFAAIAVHAADTKELGKSLQSRLQGRTLLLRGLPADKKLTFDSALNPTSEVHPGPWAGAVFEVEKVESKKDEIRIKGSCPFIVATELGSPRKIEIDIRGPIDLDTTVALDTIAKKLFVVEQVELEGLVPKPWAEILSGSQRMLSGNAVAGFLPNGETIYRFVPGAGLKMPKPISTPDPEYSEEARKAKYQGIVVMSVVIDESGNVADIFVTRAISKGLDQKAAAAVRTWKFQPAERNGKAVPVLINVEVSFNLN